jgi:putative transposase
LKLEKVTPDGEEGAMRKGRFSEEQMVGILRGADKDPVAQVAKRHCISEQTIYGWRQRFSGMNADDVKRLRQLEQENTRLKRLLAERDLEIEVMKEVAAKNGRRTHQTPAGGVCAATRTVAAQGVCAVFRFPLDAWLCVAYRGPGWSAPGSHETAVGPVSPVRLSADIGFHGATRARHGTRQGVAPLAKGRIAGAPKAAAQTCGALAASAAIAVRSQ